VFNNRSFTDFIYVCDIPFQNLIRFRRESRDIILFNLLTTFHHQASDACLVGFRVFSYSVRKSFVCGQ